MDNPAGSEGTLPNQEKLQTASDISSLDHLNSNRLFDENTQPENVEVNNLMTLVFPPEIKRYYEQYLPELVQELQKNHTLCTTLFNRVSGTDPFDTFKNGRDYKEFKGNMYEVLPGIPVFVLDPKFAKYIDIRGENTTGRGFMSTYKEDLNMPNTITLLPDTISSVVQEFQIGSTLGHELEHFFYVLLERRGILPQVTEVEPFQGSIFNFFKEELCASMVTALPDKLSYLLSYNPKNYLSRNKRRDSEAQELVTYYLFKLDLARGIGLQDYDAKSSFFQDIMGTASFEEFSKVLDKFVPINTDIVGEQVSTFSTVWEFADYAEQTDILNKLLNDMGVLFTKDNFMDYLVKELDKRKNH